MNAFMTKYGELSEVSLFTAYENGTLQDCQFQGRVELSTPYGILIPQYSSDVRKKEHYAISFYEDGSLRRISLEAAADIETSIGVFSAEQVIFYNNGNIKRLFPLNGKITAYWEEENEYGLAKKLSFTFPFGEIEVKVISISFYEDGKLKDITLWPQERIKIMTKLGAIYVRTGIAIYPDGKLKSIEPAFPSKLLTPIGSLSVYDKNAHGISGDANSLNFNEAGDISSLITSGSSVTVITDTQKEITYSPKQEVDIDGFEVALQTLHISFKEGIVIFNHSDQYEISSCRFIISLYQTIAKSQCEDCNSCTNKCSAKTIKTDNS